MTILDDVLAAMQSAEEAGGPDGAEYDDLMLRIAKEALRRVDAARSNRGLFTETAIVIERRGRPAYNVITGPHRGVVFYAEDVPSEDDYDCQVVVIFHPDAQHARQAPTVEDV